MSEAITTINDKSVRLGLPVATPNVDIVGRQHEMNKILAAWMCRGADMALSPLLVGAPGVGKNRIVYACSRLCANVLYIFQGHEDITAEDLICSIRISDDRKKQMDYTLSSLVSAMIKGGICFIDEIGKIRPRALAPLASLLDERRYLDSTLLGERIYAHSAFRLVAATNVSDLERSRLPDFILSRLRPVITIGYPDRKEIDAIINNHFAQKIDYGLSALLDLFWDLWRDSCPEHPPTPRDSLQIFGYARKLADFEAADSGQPLRLEGQANGDVFTKEHLIRAFTTFHDFPAGGEA